MVGWRGWYISISWVPSLREIEWLLRAFQRRLHYRGRAIVGFEQVAVDPERDHRRSVAEAARDRQHVEPAGNQRGRMRMTQAVECRP